MSVVSLAEAKNDGFIEELLEAWLEMARRGEIVSVVLVGEVKDEEGVSYLNASSFDDRWKLAGALDYAKFTLNHRGMTE